MCKKHVVYNYNILSCIENKKQPLIFKNVFLLTDFNKQTRNNNTYFKIYAWI